MLLSFAVENYRSIKDRVRLSFVASSIKEHLTSNTIQIPLLGLNVKKSIVLFGPNGTGKSNILNALDFISRFLKDSSNPTSFTEEIQIQPFKFDELSRDSPSFFELNFFINEDHYRYEIQLDRYEIHEEVLYLVLKTTEHTLFHRTRTAYHFEEKRFFEGKDLLRTSEGPLDRTKIKATIPVISVLSYLNGRISSEILKAISGIVFFNNKSSDQDYTASLLNDPQKKILIENFLQEAKLGYKRIHVEKKEIGKTLLDLVSNDIAIRKKVSPSYYEVEFIYDIKNKDGFPVGEDRINLRFEESTGYRKLFALAGFFIEAILSSKFLIIDEFTAGIHPRLAYHIIQSFHSAVNSVTPGQLLIASHNTYLMDEKLFRRDQIYLTYFDNGNRSTVLKTLHELKARSDVSFEKKYFDDEFGALPIPLS